MSRSIMLTRTRITRPTHIPEARYLVQQVQRHRQMHLAQGLYEASPTTRHWLALNQWIDRVRQGRRGPSGM